MNAIVAMLSLVVARDPMPPMKPETPRVRLVEWPIASLLDRMSR
jgi:hypothetical protein